MAEPKGKKPKKSKEMWPRETVVDNAATSETRASAKIDDNTMINKPATTNAIHKKEVQRLATKLNGISALLEEAVATSPGDQQTVRPDQHVAELQQTFTELTARLAVMVAVYGTEDQAANELRGGVSTSCGPETSSGYTVVQAKKRGGGKQ